jgi:hypothetical protein
MIAKGLGPRLFAGFGGIHGGSRQAVGGRSGSARNGGLAGGALGGGALGGGALGGGALGGGALGDDAPDVKPASVDDGSGAGGTAPGVSCGCVSSVGSVILDILDPARRGRLSPASPRPDRARQPCDNPGSSR